MSSLRTLLACCVRAMVVGPVGTLEQARELERRDGFDAAVLDTVVTPLGREAGFRPLDEPVRREPGAA